jgi:hypothetical protein
MSKRLKHHARRLSSLAFEALESRALLAAVADWWEDVGQWATPAWWSEESWWDDSSWWSDQASAGDWSAKEPIELGDEVELDETGDPVPDVSEAGIPEAEESGSVWSTPIVADDAAETLSDVEAITQGQGDDPSGQEQAFISDEPCEKSNDSLHAEHAEADSVGVVVAPDVESSVSEAGEPVLVALVTDEVKERDVTVSEAAGVVEDSAVSVPPAAPVHSEPVASHVAERAPEGISDERDGHGAPRVDEQGSVVAAPGAASGTPVVAVAGVPVSAIPASAVVAIEPASPRAGGMSSAAIAARRLAMWAAFLGPVTASGPGGAAGGGGESSIGPSGLTAALPVAGRPRSRLSVRRVG